MTDTTTERARSEPIKAVPVRHPWRWVGAVVVIVLAAMFIHMLVTNDHFQWKFIFVSSGPGQRGAMFTPPVLAGLRGTLLLTVLSMLIGVGLGVVLAVMRLSPSPILKWAAFGYVWFFRASRVSCSPCSSATSAFSGHASASACRSTHSSVVCSASTISARRSTVEAVDLLSGFIAGMLALALSEAAYMAEIVRAGIQSIDRARPRPHPRWVCPAIRRSAGSSCRRPCA